LVPYVAPAALAACLTLAALPAAGQVRPMSADAPPAAARSVVPRGGTAESVITWYGELQRIAAHLQWVHDRALQDPALQDARATLMHAVQAAMDRADPELARLAARAARLPVEHEDASRRGDGARAQALHREMAQIQARFMNVEAAVLRTPEIRRRSRAYEQLLRERMLAIEPGVDALLERSAALQRLLQDALGRQE
jgi:hypothetical protein